MESGSVKISNELMENLIGLFPYLREIRDKFMSIVNVIPDLLQATDSLSKKYIYDFTEMILLVLSIVIINQYKHDTILVPQTPEGTIFIVFLCLIILNVFHTTYLFLNETDVEGYALFFKHLIYDIPLYTIVGVFSLIVWIIINLWGWTSIFLSNIPYFLNLIGEKIREILSDPEDAKIFYKYGGLYSIIFIIIIIMYYAATDPQALTSKAFTYTMSIIIPLIIILTIVNPFSRKQGSGPTIFIAGVIFSFFAAIAYFYSKANAASYALMNYIVIIISILLLLIGLAIFFYIVGNYLKSLSGWSGFFVYFIFYIPCLLIDFAKYILNEFKMTANPIIILLILEILLGLFYIYLPWLIKKFNTSRNFELLPGSAYLDVGQTIGNSEMNKIPKFIAKQNNLDSQQIYNQNYGFSMWIFMNPNTSTYVGNINETQIFNYGDGKPKVTYYTDSTGLGKYRIYFTNTSIKQPYYEISMPIQKWNNLVMNFTSGQADLFVNGKLEKTYLFDENPPNYSPTDFVTIGKDGGLDGAICNVVYYPQPISIIEIANNYNILSLRNPPSFK